jgi:hypothetical protein
MLCYCGVRRNTRMNQADTNSTRGGVVCNLTNQESLATLAAHLNIYRNMGECSKFLFPRDFVRKKRMIFCHPM